MNVSHMVDSMARYQSHPWVRRMAVLAGVVMVAILAVPRQAVAWAPTCPEIYNPAGRPNPPPGINAVPGGTSTPPGTTTHGPYNPDGFYLLSSDAGDLTLSDGCPVGGDEGTTNGTFGTFPTGTTIKYTEANGTSEPRVEEMAGGSKQSDHIDYHLWGSGDLYICNTVGCTCCRVPPPPFGGPTATTNKNGVGRAALVEGASVGASGCSSAGSAAAPLGLALAAVGALWRRRRS
jgi:uncharacterized protein (TIGR03382 family)